MSVPSARYAEMVAGEAYVRILPDWGWINMWRLGGALWKSNTAAIRKASAPQVSAIAPFSSAITDLAAFQTSLPVSSSPKWLLNKT